jgi:hypothetical protein
MAVLEAIGAPVSEAAAALALAVCSLFWLEVSRGFRRGPRTYRLADGFLLLAWIAIVAFHALASTGLYRLLPAVAATGFTGLLALAASRRSGRPSPDQPNEAFPSEPHSRRALLLVVGSPIAVLAALRLLKGLVAPSLAWDTLTYHLPKAAMWVQSGELALPEIPDAWSYYAWYPAGSEILSSWLVLATRDDNLIGPFGFLIWLLILTSSARLARLLGATGLVAWMAGIAVASLPCILAFMTTGYTDNPAVLFQLLAVTHALDFQRSGRTSAAVHAAAATGLGAAVKITGLALAIPTVALLGWGLLRHSRRTVLVPALAAVMLLPCAGYFRSWMVTGSPVYPSKAPLAGKLDLPYHEGLERVTSGRALPQGLVRPRGLAGAVQLFWQQKGGRGHMNFGLGGLVLAFLAGAAFFGGIAQSRHRTALLYLFSGAALVTPLFMGPSTLALRTIWIGVLGRLLISAYAPAFLCVSLLTRRVAVFGLCLAIAGNLVHALPLGWSRAMYAPAGLLLLLAVALAGAGYLADRLARGRSRRQLRLAVVAAALLLFYVPWDSLRNRVRYPIYAETGEQGDAFDAHALHKRFPTQLPLWRFLDSPEAKRIAVTVGWEETGQNQFLYPLLGSRLQNRLTYIPITPEGRDSHLWHSDRRSRADPESWLQRLDALSPDYLVGLAPDTLEREWVEARPGRFRLLPVDPSGDNWIAQPR